MSTLRRFSSRLGSGSAHRRDRNIPEDDHTHPEQQQQPVSAPPMETVVSPDDILARYSNKSSTSVDSTTKVNPIADESHTETITVGGFFLD